MMRKELYYTLAAGIAALMLFVVVPVYGASTTESYSNYLYQGQKAMHVITMNCNGQISLTGPYGANFDLYAMKGSGSWSPTESYVMSHYDKAAVNYGQSETMSLETGTWYVVVYAQSGFGQYQLQVSSSCPVDPCYGDPCCGNPNCGSSCAPYKVDQKTGYLNAGEWKTVAYKIGGERSYIEWILKGPCGDEIPVVMMSADQVNSMRTSYCGTNFDLYIYKDCDPRNYGCYAQYADTRDGSNAYVGVTYPTVGSTYYAQIYAKQGSGYYTLYARSYDCDDDVVVMMSNPDSVSMMSTAQNVKGPTNNGAVSAMSDGSDEIVSAT